MAWWCWMAGLLGCAHRVAIETSPPGASITRHAEVVGVAPEEVPLVWTPWAHERMTVRVQLSGYRRVDLDLSRDLGPFRLLGEVLTLRWKRLVGLEPRAIHELQLVPVHGPAGTWGPADVPD